ncbi:hypothetical protein ACE939_03470 [Aquimarina sp. W85]|uniref:hypothetical protein n=1 Tax=Aquimarina rhodophyticola TaxID=3342246 RepID=UPI00366C94E7
MKQFLAFLCVFCIAISGNGQDSPNLTTPSPQVLPTVIPPSPTVANLMSFEEVPVDYYTGQPDISIPLFSKNVHQDLVINVALRYNSQGIKVDSRSGWTGTGWSLFSGGTISRTIRGFPDESQYSRSLGVYHTDQYWDFWNLEQDEMNQYMWYAAKPSRAHGYDSALDLYQFNFLNFSGRFVVTRDGPKLLSGDPSIRLEMNQNVQSGVIDNFTIIDGLGYKYHFNIIEESYNVAFEGTPSAITNGTLNFSHVGIESKNISAWHLSRITTSNNKELVNFDYHNVHEEYLSSSTWTTNTVISMGNGYSGNQSNLDQLKPKEKTSFTAVSTITKKLSNINFKDGTSIHFTLGEDHPETGGKVLKNIKIFDNNGLENTKYSFNYEKTDRLWLIGFNEISINEESNPYHFSYFEKENLSSFGSDSDPTGFNSKFPYSSNTIKAGILTSIKYPTAGIKEFIWEGQTFSYKRTDKLDISEFIENPENSSQQLFSDSFTAFTPFVSSHTAMTKIKIDYAQRIKIKIDNVQDFQNIEDRVKVILSQTNSLEEGSSLSLKANAHDYLELEAGVYNVFVQYMGYNIDPNFTFVNGRLQISYRSQTEGSLSEFLFGGGVRIKEIIFKDSLEVSLPQKQVIYSYNNPYNNKESSGVMDFYSTGKGLEQVYENSEDYIFINQYYQCESVSIKYRTTLEGPDTQLTKGNHVGYQYVKVTEIGKGYTTYEYTTAKDYQSPAAVFVYPFKYAPNLDYKRGVLLNTKMFNENNQILKEVINTKHKHVEQKIAEIFKPIYPGGIVNLFSEYHIYKGGLLELDHCPLISFLPQPNSVPMSMITTVLNFGITQLEESITRDYYYDVAGVPSIIDTKINYEYNTENYQPKKITTTITEAGTTETYVEDRYYAVGDYSTNDFTPSEQAMVTRMATLHKVNSPIYVRTQKNDTMISTLKYGYNEFLPDLVALDTITSSKGVLAKENRLIYHNYDEYGNILEVSKSEGNHVIYVWGYNHSKPIAKIVNTTYVGMPATVKRKIDELVELSNKEVTKDEEQTIQHHFNILRNDIYFKDSQLTSFTYDLLKGVTSMTDPKGYTIYYTYDNFNRLMFIKDDDQELLSKYKYQYKSQQ